MKNVDTTDHQAFVLEWQAVNDPWNTPYFSTDLRDYFANNASQVLAVVYCSCEDYLAHHWDFFKKHFFQVMVEVRSVFTAWKQQNNNLNIRLNFLDDLLPPHFQIGALDWKHCHGFRLVINRHQVFFAKSYQLFCLTMVFCLVKNTPLI